jgi:hypothetical protein
MVVVDSHGAVETREKTHTGEIVLLGILGSGVLVATSLAAADGAAGWQLAAELASRFSLLLFVIAMTVEPIARLARVPTVQALGRERGGFMLAFGLSAGVSLACMSAPYLLKIEAPSAPVIVYCGLTGFILLVTLLAGHPATIRFLGAPAWRALQRVGTAYFWIAFTLIGVDHVVGPHRPNNWYGLSLLLLVAAVLIRFGDTFLTHLRRVRPPRKAV